MKTKEFFIRFIQRWVKLGMISNKTQSQQSRVVDKHCSHAGVSRRQESVLLYAVSSCRRVGQYEANNKSYLVLFANLLKRFLLYALYVGYVCVRAPKTWHYFLLITTHGHVGNKLLPEVSWQKSKRPTSPNGGSVRYKKK